jgi:hypothetical protein
MKTTISDKLYDQLTARERLLPIIAAARRADAVERRRSVGPAPSVRFEVPHHSSLATALTEAAPIHPVTLLDLAASDWQWWGLWGWQGRSRPSAAARDPGGAADAADARSEDAKELRRYGMVRYQAFLFVTHVDGRRQFCHEWHVEPEALLDFKPGWDMGTRTEARAREQAFQPEEAATFLLSETPLPEGAAGEECTLPEVLAVQSLADVWHAFIDRQVKSPRGHDSY